MAVAVDLRHYIRPGDSILIGQATGEPRSLVEALIAQRHELAPLHVFVGASFTGLFQPEHSDALDFRSFGVIGRTASLARAGVLTILPVHLGTIPDLITSGRLPVDVVLMQVSAPNADGFHSLGVMADYLQPAVERARVVLAEVNERVPFTFGDTLIAGDRLSVVVVDDGPLVTVEPRAPLPEDDVIGGLVASLIPDGATIQFGIGGTPDAVLGHLRGHHDLGVHSGLISDAVVALVEAGVVTNRCKEIDAGVTVAGALYGTERLYRWADHNDSLAMRSLNYTHHPRVLSVLGSFYAINSAIEVDVTGQINGEWANGQYLGTIGGQGAFARAAITSASGRSIVALPSTAQGGTVSRIVARTSDGITSTPRADADVIVTEYGIADVRGVSLRDRVERLIAIAHPAHRAALRDAVARG
jgi:acyl-CoA hydrolase